MSFFLLLNRNAILKKVENQTAHSLSTATFIVFFSYYQKQCGLAITHILQIIFFCIQH